MTLAVSCPRCGGGITPPNLTHSDWRCDVCGPVPPFRVAKRISLDIVSSICQRLRNERHPVPMWCPWPLPPGWLVTGVGWAGDDRAGPRASAVALSGPAPIADGPADAVLVAEEPGIGLGMSLVGVAGPDPGPGLRDVIASTPPHAKVRAAGHPTPLWSVASRDDRSAYVGEAKGMWLYAITWPAAAGYLLAEAIQLIDLVEAIPSELVFGAPSGRLERRTDGG